MYHNVEKLPGKDYYTGYARLSGVWHVKKHGKEWYAVCKTGRAAGLGAFWRRTLREVSAELDCC